MRIILLVVLACCMACSAQTDKTMRDERQQRPNIKPTVERQTQIAPGRCRIVGTLVEIDSTLDTGGPCSKAPCRGIVRVDSILGYGSAFGNPISLNAKINVKFAFTLAPTTRDLFPNMTVQLPGLYIGASFKTDLESQNDMGVGERHYFYLVQGYTKLN